MEDKIPPSFHKKRRKKKQPTKRQLEDKLRSARQKLASWEAQCCSDTKSCWPRIAKRFADQCRKEVEELEQALLKAMQPEVERIIRENS